MVHSYSVKVEKWQEHASGNVLSHPIAVEAIAAVH